MELRVYFKAASMRGTTYLKTRMSRVVIVGCTRKSRIIVVVTVRLQVADRFLLLASLQNTRLRRIIRRGKKR